MSRSEDLIEELKQSSFLPLWTIFKNLESSEPTVQFEPYLWHGNQAAAYLNSISKESVPGADVERRVLALRHPKFTGPGLTPTLSMSFQLVKPGELAPAHRHSACAVRFMVKGRAHTVINGVRVEFEENDFVVTRGGSWHDHGNESEDYALWLDGLDAPFVRGLMAWFFERYNLVSQEVYRKETMSGIQTKLEAPANEFPLIYRWRDVFPRLMSLKERTEGNPFDGVVFNYGEHHPNGSITPTLNCGLALLQPGKRTQTHRHTGCVAYYVVQGRGLSVVDGVNFQWCKGDVLLVPPWSWHDHKTLGNEDAIFFTFSDSAIVRNLGLYREEALESNGG
ncbi:MAG: cupin domain-containing protein [Deltaproteobacteria bacterium]|nr:cupin domain-containing protein [Deltaproteobacteria bacterium]